MGDFIYEANEKFEALEEAIQKVENDQKDICSLFGEDEGKFQLYSFMADLGQFLISFDDATTEIDKKKKQDALNIEKAKKKEQQKLEREKNKHLVQNTNNPLKPIPKEENDEDKDEDEEDEDDIDKKIDKKKENDKDDKSSKTTEKKSESIVDDLENDLIEGKFSKKKKNRVVDLDKLISEL